MGANKSEKSYSERWFIAREIGSTSGWMYNPVFSFTVPVSEWQYVHNGTYHDDSTIKVQAGDVKVCPEITVKVSGEKIPSDCCSGDYTHRNIFMHGRPTYATEDGKKNLYVDRAGRWTIGIDYTAGWIVSSNSPLHPSQATGWVKSSVKEIVAKVDIFCKY